MVRVIARLGLLAGLYASAVLVGWGKEEEADRHAPDVVALPSSGVARTLSFGFNNVVADLYFIRAVQYYGDPWNYSDHYKYLYPLVDLVTDVDPQFREPLTWGAIAIQQNLGKEVWLNTAESTRLLQKGVRLFPEDWRFHVFLAYNLSTFHHDYIAAAEALKGARGLKNSPDYLEPLITRLYATAGDLETAERLAMAVVSGTEDPEVARAMQERMVDIETERELRKIDDAIDAFQAARGTWPTGIHELLIAGTLAEIPKEPRGGTFYIDPKSHEARSSKLFQRLRLFDPGAVNRRPKKEASKPEEQ